MRPASHAGSWYPKDPQELCDQIDALLESGGGGRTGGTTRRLLAIVSPHAGIRFSGATAAKGYCALLDYLMASPRGTVKRIFVLGPSHHQHMRDTCVVSGCAAYDTPFGPILVDTAVVASLGLPTMALSMDSEEHALEMQMPFLARIITRCELRDVKIVPILVGSMSSPAAELAASVVLAPYMASPENIFIFSSDFCHWGSRFRYSYHYQKETIPAIGDAIIAMDREGMDHIEKKDIASWHKYLETTKNTICGRHPIGMLLQMISQQPAANQVLVKFVGYSQSNRCADKNDSSVSYASGCVWDK